MTTQIVVGAVAESESKLDNYRVDLNVLLQTVQATGLLNTPSDPVAWLQALTPDNSEFIKLTQDFGFEGGDETVAFQAIDSALTALSGGKPNLHMLLKGKERDRILANDGPANLWLIAATTAACWTMTRIRFCDLSFVSKSWPESNLLWH
ncbi:MAG: hypothetical protein AAGB19_11065 [Cyanobacteria bacterium P01_F01_bin.3]